jgi:hypothetical protein
MSAGGVSARRADGGIYTEGVYKKFNAREVLSYDEETESLNYGPWCKIFAVVNIQEDGKIFVTLIKMRDEQIGEAKWLSWFPVDGQRRNTDSNWNTTFVHKLGDMAYSAQEYY